MSNLMSIDNFSLNGYVNIFISYNITRQSSVNQNKLFRHSAWNIYECISYRLKWLCAIGYYRFYIDENVLTYVEKSIGLKKIIYKYYWNSLRTWKPRRQFVSNYQAYKWYDDSRYCKVHDYLYQTICNLFDE